MAAFANDGGMLPEQVWDGEDIPDKELWKGRPSGSAMPLVWAHAEYLKLWRSLREGAVFDMPPQPVERYRGVPRARPFRVWRFNHKLRSMPAGLELRIETLEPARIHWSADGWATRRDEPSADTGLGLFVARIPTAGLPPGTAVTFTVFWPGPERWEGTDFRVELD
jgi:glucoamylase